MHIYTLVVSIEKGVPKKDSPKRKDPPKVNNLKSPTSSTYQLDTCLVMIGGHRI